MSSIILWKILHLPFSVSFLLCAWTTNNKQLLLQINYICLFFFDIWILIAPLVSSNFSKSLQRWKKDFFADTERISGLNSIYFHAKTILSGDYFLAYFGLWSVIHSNRTRFIFSWTMNVTSFSPFLKITILFFWTHLAPVL